MDYSLQNQMMEEKILTLHPQNKKGVNISKKKYDQIVAFILDALNHRDSMTFSDMGDLAVEELADKFEGSILWYFTTVKLDLEARKVIERIPKTSP
ncbi:MAG: hypothetical protein AAF985_25015, partial [Bacteroidota bacterium]